MAADFKSAVSTDFTIGANGDCTAKNSGRADLEVARRASPLRAARSFTQHFVTLRGPQGDYASCMSRSPENFTPAPADSSAVLLEIASLLEEATRHLTLLAHE